MYKVTTTTIAIAAVALILGACGDRTKSTQGTDTDPVGKVASYTSCKSGTMAASQTEIPKDQDCIEYAYDGHSVLHLRHVNAGFNCCPDSLLAEFEVSSGQIVIDEAEDLTTGGCDCLCLYDLNYEITGLKPGLYDITVNEMYLDSEAEMLEFTLDLTSLKTGTFCVTRDFYPWQTDSLLVSPVIDGVKRP